MTYWIMLMNILKSYQLKEDIARNSLMVIDSSIHEKGQLREEFDISDEGKELHSLKTIRRKDKTSITQMSDDIYNRDFKIDELNNKRERFSNDISNIKRYKYKLKQMKEGRKNRNRVDPYVKLTSEKI